jgi:hypothetical protein
MAAIEAAINTLVADYTGLDLAEIEPHKSMTSDLGLDETTVMLKQIVSHGRSTYLLPSSVFFNHHLQPKGSIVP